MLVLIIADIMRRANEIVCVFTRKYLHRAVSDWEWALCDLRDIVRSRNIVVLRIYFSHYEYALFNVHI